MVNKHRGFRFVIFAVATLSLLLLVTSDGAGAALIVLPSTATALKDNPLDDPIERKIAVFIPNHIESGANLPVVYFLPGYGSGPEDFIQDPETWDDAVQQSASQGTPFVLVVPDGTDHWGFSQCINSPAQGNYGDYLSEEVVSQVEDALGDFVSSDNKFFRVLAGFSSGGFGALRLGMDHPEIFNHVIAISPDSDFNVSHLPIVTNPSVQQFSLSQLHDYESNPRSSFTPPSFEVQYVVSLSAAYAAVGDSKPGWFHWLYDDNHNFREDIWTNYWLANDPLQIVMENEDAFTQTGSLYLDGGAKDQYKNNIGAKKIADILIARMIPAAVRWYEFPGGHGDDLTQRLVQAIQWTAGQN